MESIKTDPHLPLEPVFEQSSSENDKPWVPEGVVFPHGTELRGKYKGYVYYGNVDNGALKLNGKEFLSPCAAAITITRNPVDGWLFWDCKLPDCSDWKSIYEFKNECQYSVV